MVTLVDVVECANKYCETYSAQIISAGPELSELRVLFEQCQKWPQADHPGVYCVFDTSGRLLYVGKASMTRKIGHRLYVHFPPKPEDRTKFDVSGGVAAWGGEPTYLYCFAVAQPWEAASLEEYLIHKLTPPANRQGVSTA